MYQPGTKTPMSDWQHPFDAHGVLRCHWEELQDVRLVAEGWGELAPRASSGAEPNGQAHATAAQTAVNGTHASAAPTSMPRRRPTQAGGTGPPPLATPRPTSTTDVPTEVVAADGVWADVAAQLRAKKQQLQAQGGKVGAGVATPGATRPRPGVRRAALGPLLARLAGEG